MHNCEIAALQSPQFVKYYYSGMQSSRNLSPSSTAETSGLRFNRFEWAGAFGDLGTLIPFVIAYIALGHLDPVGIFLSFGLALCATGAYYRTPFPVQPMKAIGAAAATQAGITAGTIYAAGLITGVIWIILGITGAAHRIAKLLPRPVAVGIILGLGIGFMLEGVRMMASAWVIAVFALTLALLLIDSRRFPVMFLLLAGGAAYQLVLTPELLDQMREIDPHLRLPAFTWPEIGMKELGLAAVMLALPQVPLTLGNAIIAVSDENNRIFPHRPVTEKQVAISTGIMNIGASAIGGVPMCHGAGGMAGHVRFGATTGGAPIILGMLLIVLALFFGSSIETLLKLFPAALLGVILFIAGAQLALGSCDFSSEKNERFATLVTTAFAIWNVGAAFVAGAAILYALKRGWIRL
ncbi:MAG TPA: putative sulfate/molybdate transporter [Burkholderiales bacterium]|nr:putative sulfate/molybdate transporter [Burkholderiales bacterium]